MRLQHRATVDHRLSRSGRAVAWGVAISGVSTDHRHFNANGEKFNVGETFTGVALEQGIALVEKIKAIPQYVVHGDNDKTVPVEQSRVMVEAGKKLGTPIVYVEVPKGSHVDIAVPNFAPMLDFFVKQ